MNDSAGMTLKGTAEVMCRLSLAVLSSASSEKLATQLLADRLVTLLGFAEIKIDRWLSMLNGKYQAHDFDCAARLPGFSDCLLHQQIKRAIWLRASFEGLSCKWNGDSFWRTHEGGSCAKSEAQVTESYSRSLQFLLAWPLGLVDASHNLRVL